MSSSEFNYSIILTIFISVFVPGRHVLVQNLKSGVVPARDCSVTKTEMKVFIKTVGKFL